MEMARMLGGEHLSDATMAHAREMLSMARLSAEQQTNTPKARGNKAATATRRAGGKVRGV